MSSLGNRRRIKKDVDHISNLPDTVLCYILSFLTTKSAVKTSILSKRWKYVWTKVPALDFTKIVNISMDRQLSLEEKICLKDGIDKVLLHNDASFVQRFCLDVVDVDAFYVNSWVIAASRREMHEIDIVLDDDLDVCCLPPRFLLSEKLVVLKLQGPISISALVSFHLPNLETIHLSDLKFPDDEFMKKLSSCTVLRELHIVNCCVKATTICVEFLFLKTLIIKETHTFQEKVCIAIKTPNLTHLRLDECRVSFDIGDMRSLIKADLNVVVDDYLQEEELLRKVSGVKYLHLRSEALLSGELPVFPNLTRLNCHAAMLSKTLHCAPKLKSLILPYFGEDPPFDPNFAPKLLPCLESVEICCFFGHAEEFVMIEYFLKAASGLKQMKINFDFDYSFTFERYDVTTVLSIYQKLLDIPRSSAVCRVKISGPNM